MPSSTVIAVLAYPDVAAAIEWLCRCFGLEERLRIGNHRAQLAIGTGAVVVAGAPPGPGISSIRLNVGHSVMVRIADVDAHHRHALAEGARVLSPPTDYPYGERQYSVEDLAGHVWTFSQTIADVDPASWGGVLKTTP